jgi:hypothetical protein
LVLDQLTLPTSASMAAAGPTRLHLQDSIGRVVPGLFAVSARVNDSQCPASNFKPPPLEPRVTQARFYGRPPVSISDPLVVSDFRTVGFTVATNVTMIVIAVGRDCQDVGEIDSVAIQPARMSCDASGCWKYQGSSGSIRYKYASFVLQSEIAQPAVQVTCNLEGCVAAISVAGGWARECADFKEGTVHRYLTQGLEFCLCLI